MCIVHVTCVVFFKGGTLTIVGTYLLVTFAPNITQELTARKIQNYLVSWQFLICVVSFFVIL